MRHSSVTTYWERGGGEGGGEGMVQGPEDAIQISRSLHLCYPRTRLDLDGDAEELDIQDGIVCHLCRLS